MTGYRLIRAAERQQTDGQNLHREWGVSAATAGSTGLSMAFAVAPVGVKSIRHSHPFETAVYVLRGRGTAYFGPNDEEAVEVGAGDFLYIAAHVIHSHANTGDEPLEYILARAAAEDVVIPAGPSA